MYINGHKHNDAEFNECSEHRLQRLEDFTQIVPEGYYCRHCEDANVLNGDAPSVRHSESALDFCCRCRKCSTIHVILKTLRAGSNVALEQIVRLDSLKLLKAVLEMKYCHPFKKIFTGLSMRIACNNDSYDIVKYLLSSKRTINKDIDYCLIKSGENDQLDIVKIIIDKYVKYDNEKYSKAIDHLMIFACDDYRGNLFDLLLPEVIKSKSLPDGLRALNIKIYYCNIVL